MNSQTFKASYFYRLLSQDWNPFTPDIITIDANTVEYKRRNWYLISTDTQTYHFQNIIGVDIDKGFLGADIAIKTTGSAKITAVGFSKRKAEKIKQLCKKHIAAHSNKGIAERQRSVADELKKLKELLDSGVITQKEFDLQKDKLIG